MAKPKAKPKAKGEGRRITPAMRRWTDAVKAGRVRRDARGRIIGMKGR